MSLTAVVDTAISIPFTLTDANGDTVAGKVNADFTATAYLASAPATTATPTVTEVSGGDYVVTLTPDDTGVWSVRWSVVVDGETVRYGEIVQVVTAAQYDPVQALAGASITLVSPVAASADVTLYAGDDYASSEARALVWTLTGAPDLTGATVTWLAAWHSGTLSQAGVVSDAGEAAQTVTVQLTDTQTAALPAAEIVRYDLGATLANGNKVTLARGAVRVVGDMP